jgi:hypothetical protein
MSFENDGWQNIEREYKIFRRPHGENSERTDALAVATPPSSSTLEMLRSVVSVNPTPDGTQGNVPELGLGSSDSLLRDSSDSAPIQPRNTESQWVLGIRLRHVSHLHSA